MQDIARLKFLPDKARFNLTNSGNQGQNVMG